jgi:hypothetical protein
MKKHFHILIAIFIAILGAAFAGTSTVTTTGVPATTSATPQSIEQKVFLWLEADSNVYTDDGTTPASSNGDLIYYWKSKVGPITIKQTTSGSRPVFVTPDAAINNQKSLNLGSNKFMELTAQAGNLPPELTAYFLVQRDWTSTPAAIQCLYAIHDSTYPLFYISGGAPDAMGASAGDIVGCGNGYSGSVPTPFVAGPVSTTGSAFKLIVIRMGTSPLVRVNGATVTTRTSGVSSARNAMVASGGATNRVGCVDGAFFWSAKIAAMLIVSESQSVSDIQQMESYFNTKYAVY